MVKIIQKLCDIKGCKNEADDMELPYVRLFETTQGLYRYMHPSLGEADYHICDKHRRTFELDNNAVIYTYGAQGYDEHTIRRLILVEPTEDCEPDEPVDLSEYSLEAFQKYLINKYPEHLYHKKSYLVAGVYFKHNDEILIEDDGDIAYRTMRLLLGDDFIGGTNDTSGIAILQPENYEEFDNQVAKAIKILEERGK